MVLPLHIIAMNKLYRCDDCDEVTTHETRTTRSLMCQTCGATLTLVPPENTQPDRDRRLESLDDLFEIFGSDLRDSIMEAMSQSQPTRQISVSYLNTLGKVIVDDRKTILRDISLSIGPLNLLAVSAQFGYLPEENLNYSHQIVPGMPICGESSLTNKAECNGAMVLLERGVVSFATKCIRAIEAGAAAVIVSQAAGVWPFVMADSAKELLSAGVEINIPVVMISQKDAEIVRKMLREQDLSQDNTSTNTTTVSTDKVASSRDCHLKTMLKFGPCVQECSICQEDFAVSDSVLKLPCRHVYHTDCVTNWLAMNNTCPLCRLELPKEVGGKALPSRTPAAPVDPSRMYYV